jgi:hypothetical protein
MNRKDTRFLTVNGTPWEYKIGRNTVALYDPEGKPYYVKFTDIHTKEEIDKGRGYLNPTKILDYILTKILNDTSIHNRCVSCKTVKADVFLRPNPFNSEIYEDYTPHYLCNDCVSELAEEI